MDKMSMRQVEQKLGESTIRTTVTQAGLYLVAFELLRSDVVDQTKGFFADGFDQSWLKYSSRYQTDVLSLAPNPYDASAKWLVTVAAITPEQAKEPIAVRRHRNEIAHELPKLLIDPGFHLSPALLEQCRFFVDLLGRFWGGVAVDTTGDFEGKEIDYDSIRSSNSLLLEHIWQSVHGQTT